MACFLDQGLGTVGKKLGRESGRFSSEVDFNSSVLLNQKVLVIDCVPWCAVPCAPDDRSAFPVVERSSCCGKQALPCPVPQRLLEGIGSQEESGRFETVMLALKGIFSFYAQAGGGLFLHLYFQKSPLLCSRPLPNPEVTPLKTSCAFFFFLNWGLNPGLPCLAIGPSSRT